MPGDLSPRERIEIIVEQLRVAGMPLVGPEPDWRSLIEVWRHSLVDALAALPPDVRHYTIEADGDTTPYILCRDDDACEWTPHPHRRLLPDDRRGYRRRDRPRREARQGGRR